jgi:branched-chain amino acid transport system permease protein
MQLTAGSSMRGATGAVIGNLLILYQAPALGVQLLVDGILIGAVFALAAHGMALVWGVTNIINVAQGEFVMLGGFVAVLCAEHGLPLMLAVPIAAAVLYALGSSASPSCFSN